MKKKFILDLHSIADIETFVAYANYIDSDIRATVGRKSVDAKEFEPLTRIATEHTIVTIDSNDVDEINRFMEICRRYEVRE